MRWPWQRQNSQDELVISWSDHTFAYALARVNSEGRYDLLAMGIEHQGTDADDVFIARLNALQLKQHTATVMLRPEQYQFLQIPAPVVPQEELKSAIRYLIRDRVDVHIDDLTIDVIYLGDAQQKTNPQVFVAAAKTAHIRSAMELVEKMNWRVTVIDVQETCQRNLQTALASREATLDRADAALLITGAQDALFTISVNGELYYTRRLDLPKGFLDMAWSQAGSTLPDSPDRFTPVREYVPDYVGNTSALDAGADAPVNPRRALRLVLEVQRSLDLWDRSWSGLPLSCLRVHAGDRSEELATWLHTETGQTVKSMNLETMFSGLTEQPEAVRNYCLPLLGFLLRDSSASH